MRACVRARVCVRVCVCVCLLAAFESASILYSSSVWISFDAAHNLLSPFIAEIPPLPHCGGICLQQTHAATDACCNATAFLQKTNGPVAKNLLKASSPDFSYKLSVILEGEGLMALAMDPLSFFSCTLGKKVKAVCREKKLHLSHNSFNISYIIIFFHL